MVLTNSGHHSQIVKGLLDMCLLGCINQEPNYGYQLVKHLNGFGWNITNEKTIYPVLKRLSRDGLIDSTLQESPSGPARKYHSTTEAGRALLAEWVEDWHHVKHTVDAVLDTSGAPRPNSKGHLT